ncbi:MAG: TIGR00730 family Rossman fold protein [Vicinamibacterales bacterium]
MSNEIQRVCVYCGSSHGDDPVFGDAAEAFGRALARRGITLVYGGGLVGLMGRVADAALGEGGRVTGVIPAGLVRREVAHRGLSDLHVVATMHERKARMADLSDAFVALPGGMGTLDEMCEILTWAQLGLHTKPCAFLDVAGYYQPLMAFFDQLVQRRFLKSEHRDIFFVDNEPDRLIDRLATHRVPEVDKLLDKPKP